MTIWFLVQREDDSKGAFVNTWGGWLEPQRVGSHEYFLGGREGQVDNLSDCWGGSH